MEMLMGYLKHLGILIFLQAKLIILFKVYILEMTDASNNDSNNFVIKQFSSSVFSQTRNAIFGAKSLELRLHTYLAIKHKVLKSYIFFDGLAKRGREGGFCMSTSTETIACTILYVVLRKMINLNIYK
jgi:hypothetical protein